MKTFTTLAAFAAGTNALVGRGNSCCFHLTASGGASGTIGQLGDGQNRIGGGLPETQFCIDSNGGITDSSGRGCIVTSSTTQFQCDLGSTPVSGFSISSSGELEYKGDADFVACQTGDNGELNLYTTESSSATGCEDIKLTADSCSGTGAGAGAASSGSVPAASSTPAPGPGASASVPGGPQSSVPSGAGAVGAGGSSTAPGAPQSSAPAGPGAGAGAGGSSGVPGGAGAGAGGSTAPGAPQSSAPAGAGAGSSGVPGGAGAGAGGSTAPAGAGAGGSSGVPGGAGAGAGGSTAPAGAGAGGAGGSGQVTVYTTVTATQCAAETTSLETVPAQSTVPVVPGGGGSSAPAGSQPGAPAPSETPSTPGAGGAGGQPSGSPAPSGAGAQPSGSPAPSETAPGGGAQPSGSPAPSETAPGGGAQPSGSPAPSETAPGAGGAGSQPSGSPAPSETAPGGGAQPSGSPAPSGAGAQPSGSPAPSETPSTGESSGAQPSETPAPQTSESAAPQSSGSASTSSTATQSSSASCPTDLSGDYEYPHLIVPVNSSAPDTAFGTQFFGTVSSTVSTIFNFDIPSSDSGKTCSLIFLLPNKDQLETSSYTFSGDGKVDFSLLESAASQSTTYNTVPSVKQDYGDFTLSSGNSYLISSFSCPAGETVSYEMKEAGSTYLNFFEDYNPSPLGLYITVC
ncbi:hypothetical protein BO71DRAFT_485085 [Aspergillus ellipticus CBS 707.79]|uniref:Uncharacterized protein n=1 Tax=Aspergillus ellipticus CBS 707.79 TaxID=1448320 RepID=A0A319D639_9EURO|nr:hypothetical protein BO71DRAFT_485085 [Aspergillus ellipticus CBS 707.79]